MQAELREVLVTRVLELKTNHSTSIHSNWVQMPTYQKWTKTQIFNNISPWNEHKRGETERLIKSVAI